MAKQTVSLRLEAEMLAAVDAKLQELGIDRTAYIAGLIAQDLGCNTTVLQPQYERNTSVLQNAIQDALQQALAPIRAEIAELKKPDGAIA
jgi:hypothetical protein